MTAATTPSVVVTRPDDGVVLVTLNRPHKLNAVDPPMARELLATARSLSVDPSVRVVVLAGAGRSFCAGSDIGAIDETDPREAYRTRDLTPPSYPDFGRELLQPVIAAVHGHCLGGGFELALHCDMRIASRDATFATPEVKWGWLGGGGTTQLLPRLIGAARVMEMLCTGEPISADVAERWGLLNALVDEGRATEDALALARRIADKPPLVTQAAKKGIAYGMNTPLDVGLRVERELAMATFDTDEKRAGVRSFTTRGPGSPVS